MLFIAILLLGMSIYLVAFQVIKDKIAAQEAHLPSQAFKDASDLSSESEEVTKISGESWLPLSSRFRDFASRIPFPTKNLQHKLIEAGSPVGVLEFLAFKLLLLIFIPVLSLTFFGHLFSKEILLLTSLAIGYFLPEMILKSKIKRRQHRMARDLPNIIDLLTLCVGGGLDFMLAVNRVIRDLKKCDLTIELSEVYRQTQMGKSRVEALKNFAWRLDMPEVYSFVRTLVQADRMGSPIADALRMQSEEIRVRRFQRGEAMALKAPIKLLFPLFVFILPVVLILVGGPIILQFVRGGAAIGF